MARTVALPFTQVTNGSVYASFLLNVRSNPVSTRVFLGMGGGSTNTGSTGLTPYCALYLDQFGNLSISKYNNDVNVVTPPLGSPSVPVVLSNTYLVVLRYTFSTNTEIVGNEFDLWLNPSPIGDDNNVPPPTISTTSGTDLPFIQSFLYICPSILASSYSLLFFMDELRVGTNWSAVTPPSCSPGTLFPVGGGGTNCAPASFPVVASNTLANCDYWLCKNGAPTGTKQTGTGSQLTFSGVNVSGVYTILESNRTTGCIGFMNGNANVAVNTSPSVSTQPITTVVVTNGQAAISVVSGGSALTYQWRKNQVKLTNNVGHYFGVTNSTLIIYPATSADAATAANGYDCVVSGVCPPTNTSARVALTLTSQTNLYWYGGTTNVWDVTVSQDWTTVPTGFPDSVFNYGKNVIFDESAYPISPIILADPNLTPTSVTVSNDFDVYAFTGTGSISGSNSALFKTDTGTLIISNANSYAGGTTISGGNITIYNPNALGVGTINLAGGKLNTTKGGNLLNNSINVVSSSSLVVGNSGTSALLMYGTLNGAGGTLTISYGDSNSIAGAAIRLENTNISFGRPIVFNVTNSVVNSTNSTFGIATNLFLDGYNTNGIQEFDGLISGSAVQLQRQASGGTTILSAQNTFSGSPAPASFFLSAGLLGFAADSTPTIGGPITSGPIGTGALELDNRANMYVFAVGGPHTIANPIIYSTNDNGSTLIFSGMNDLNLSGPFDLTGTTRTIGVTNITGASIISGVITDDGGGYGINKVGPGTLTLSGNNTYTGLTTISNGTLSVNGQVSGPVIVTYDPSTNNAYGTLGGSGTILGDVTVQSGGTLSPGNSIGTLTINGALTFQAGSTNIMEINKTTSTNDEVTGLTSVTYGGTLVVTNLAGTLTNTDSFKLFDAASYSGAFASITPAVPGAGLTWNTNTLTTDGILRITGGQTSSEPTVIRFTSGSVQIQNGTNLVFSGTNNGIGTYSMTLWSSTNVDTYLTNWVLESSNTYTSPMFGITNNNFGKGTPHKFYILRAP